jgi:peptide/nickel transport system ATP-binding protein
LNTSESEELLKVVNLKTYYHNEHKFIRAVDGVSFAIAAQGRIGIAGESGSGKTQTVLSLIGLVDGTPGIIDGEIWFNGKNLLEGIHRHVRIHEEEDALIVEKNVHYWHRLHQKRLNSLRGSKVEMLFQEPKNALSPFFSVGDQLQETVCARFGAEAGKRYQEKVIPLLENLHFKNPVQLLRQYPHQLSGGEGQRVMMAMTLVGNPLLLIADEPTTLLDAVTQFSVVDTLAAVMEQQRFALLFISHNLAVLSRLVQYIYIMFSGRIIEQGSVAEIICGKNEGLHPYTKALLDAVSLKRERRDDTVAGELKSIETEKNEIGCRYFLRCPLKDGLQTQDLRKCRKECPPLFAISSSHSVACWLKERGI